MIADDLLKRILHPPEMQIDTQAQFRIYGQLEASEDACSDDKAAQLTISCSSGHNTCCGQPVLRHHMTREINVLSCVNCGYRWTQP